MLTVRVSFIKAMLKFAYQMDIYVIKLSKVSSNETA